ncbi:MAG: DNA-deoxyinosine glycosylase [Clostridiales bacterium]|nr:DNA-deoxyinosine glycosylase [Clostridiales bacterium]
MIVHPIPPVYDENSEILILGSFPSVKSREQGFFYGHPQNRFWKVVSAIYGLKAPNTIKEKREMLLTLKIAIWDVIGSCEIEGSADNTIKNVAPNDISVLLEKTKIKRIFVNGNTAKKYYDKYIKDITKIDAVCLPSTSPANASFSLDKLISVWQEIKG